MRIHDFEAEPREDMVLTLRCFTTKVKESGIIFALIARTALQKLEVGAWPTKIHAFLDDVVELTLTKLPQMLPSTCNIQHAINLILGATLLNMVAYGMSPLNIRNYSDKFKIYSTKGSFAKALVSVQCYRYALQRRMDCGMCIEIRAINRIIFKYWFLIPHLDDMLNVLRGAQILLKGDLQNGYHQTRLCVGDEWKWLSRQDMAYLNGL